MVPDIVDKVGVFVVLVGMKEGFDQQVKGDDFSGVGHQQGHDLKFRLAEEELFVSEKGVVAPSVRKFTLRRPSRALRVNFGIGVIGLSSEALLIDVRVQSAPRDLQDLCDA